MVQPRTARTVQTAPWLSEAFIFKQPGTVQSKRVQTLAWTRRTGPRRGVDDLQSLAVNLQGLHFSVESQSIVQEGVEATSWQQLLVQDIGGDENEEYVGSDKSAANLGSAAGKKEDPSDTSNANCNWLQFRQKQREREREVAVPTSKS